MTETSAARSKTRTMFFVRWVNSVSLSSSGLIISDIDSITGKRRYCHTPTCYLWGTIFRAFLLILDWGSKRLDFTLEEGIAWLGP